ncbi:hypothetical protein GCM10008018_21850 [Paenibacillus marchantiophytorum]|uniref:Heparinase n=1 Tax=Paenibacillus marchantiophytorum TaxID=1619310 RepID=A0ABQ1EKP6_9BACL|nr:alginate lyase family protein [Paenibacillus marchantiophytorum]GFZ76035.1 hypothetical protein GCM10008018_21850 [Paenibacillus marchantiophytorum]
MNGDYDKLIELLELGHPGLQEVREAASNRDTERAIEALKRHFLLRSSPVLFIRDEDKPELIEYVNRNCQHDVTETLQIADEVVRQTFLFRYRWDMERTHVPVTFEGPIQWDHVPAYDEEWAYMLNRHRYWLSLGQAYWLTGDEIYAETFSRQLEDWIDRTPLTPEAQAITWRTIEAGIRCENWIKAFQYFKHSPHFTSKLFAKMLLSLYEHGSYIAAHNDGWRNISNWGVLENHGLFELSVFAPEFKHSMEWRELAVRRLKEMARLQVAADGMHWEQSPMYHNEVFHCLLDNLILSQKNNIPFDKSVSATAHRMAYADLYMAKPNGHQPMQGDSDNTDVRDLLTLAAIYFNDGALKFGAYPRVDFDSVWSFGPESIQAYERLKAETPPHASHAFKQSGNFVMRSGWDEEALYLYFHCGHLGGGHGHADMLHIDLYAYGRDLLTDLGRYTYSNHFELRNYLKANSSHNTTQVDGIDFTECKDSWTFGRIARPVGADWISSPKFDYAEGSHDGYHHLNDPVYPLRRILFVKPGYWVLSDSFDSKEEHTFAQFFHFAPGEIVVDPSSKTCFTNEKKATNLCIIPVHPDPLQAHLQEGYISYSYNSVETNKSVAYETRAKGFASMMCVLYPQKPGETEAPFVESLSVHKYNGDTVNPTYAQACKIKSPGSDEEHIVVICHRRPSVHLESYLVDGIQIFGEVVLIKKRGETDVEVMVVK